MATKLNENTELSMPIRNLMAMVVGAAIGTWAYFGIIERLNTMENKIILMEADLGQNTDFRIKWPRGEMGALPADSEQFMLIEHLSEQLAKLQEQIDQGRAPHDQQQKLTLDFYEKRGKGPKIFYRGPTEDSAMQKAWNIIKADVDFKLLIPDYLKSKTTGGIYDRRTGNIEIYPSSVYKYLKAKLQRTPKDEELQKFVVALINHEAGHAADYSVNPSLDMFWDEQQVDASREWVAFQSQHPNDPYLAMVGFLKHPYTFKLVGPRGQPARGVDYLSNNVTQEHHTGLPTSIKNIVAYVDKHAKTPKQKNKLATLELSQRGRKVSRRFPTNVLGAVRRYGEQHTKFLKTLRW